MRVNVETLLLSTMLASLAGCPTSPLGTGGDAAVADQGVGDLAVAGADLADVPRSCGGRGGQPCPSGTFCELEAGTCGAADQGGVCLPTPVACTKILKPVCGCDQKTYDNDCERQKAGVSFLHDDTCATPACGGGTTGYCSGALACSCCPAGGPTEHCVCSTPCVKDTDCTDPLRPVCTSPGTGQTGFCAEKGFTCCWLCN